MISRHVGGAGARTVAVLVLLAVVSSSCDGRSQEPGLAWTADSCVSCGKSSFPTPSACVVSNTTIDPAAPGCCLDRAALDLLSKLLGVLRGAALTATAAAVDAGDSPFGAAVLDAGQGHAVLHADANKIQSSRSPMAHGEVSTINSYFATQPPLPPPERTVFLSTHQPCSICLSSLAFSGFRRVFYAFDYEQSINGGEDAGDVLDGHVIEQLFHARCARLNHTNGMFTLVPLRAALLAAPCEHSASATLQALRREYDQAKASYRTLGRRFQQAMAARNSGSNGGSGGGSDGQQPQLQLLAGACVGCKPFPRPECEEAGYDRSGRDGWPPVGSGEEL